MNELEREEDFLLEQLQNGEISQSEYNRAMKEAHYQYSREARFAAEEAYDRELENW